MKDSRPYCLSIAGFDPCAGAGVLADIKTFEANKVNGMAVVTGLTFQNDSEFDGVKWIETEQILKQIEVLLRKFHFDFIKIGMIRDLQTLNTILSYLTSHISHITSHFSYLPSPISNLRIIWDPIVKTSSGFDIQNDLPKDAIIDICKKIYLVTPNIDEIRILMNQEDEMNAAEEISRYCNVFLKGGHSETNKGRDFLFPFDLVSANNSEKELSFSSPQNLSPLSFGEGKGVRSFRAKKISAFPKHGSGCVLSSAITANLAKGESLLRACLKGKNYVTEFLLGNKVLLGYHKL